MDYVSIKDCKVSRFILGSNPFSAFSHQGEEMDWRMIRYFKTAKIKEILRQAERVGVNTVLGRADHHIMRTLLEYWDEGGKIQWFAQTCPGVGAPATGVGHVVQAIHDLALDDNTIFLFTTDHGDATGSHKHFEKSGTMYDEVYRIPLIVKGPDRWCTPQRTDKFV